MPLPSAALRSLTGATWLLYLQIDGNELLIGEQDRDAEAGDEDWLVWGRLPEVELTEAIRQAGDTSLSMSLSLSIVLPVDVAAIPGGISGATAELSRWTPGTDLSARRVVLRGRVRDPEYGEMGEPTGMTIEDQPWQRSAILPTARQRVDGVTWPDSILDLQEAHLGAAYPIVFGRPGAKSDGTRASATPARWVWHAPVIPGGAGYSRYVGMILVIAGHHVNAERVYVHLDEYPTGFRVPVFNGTDGRGSPIAFVPWYATISGTDEPYDYDPAGTYTDSLVDFDGDPTYGLGSLDTLPDGTAVSALTKTSSQPQFWVSWDDEESLSQGGMVEGGRLVREAGDVLAWILRRMGGVDAGSVAAAAPFLRGFRLDFGIYSAADLWEVVQAHLLPILPISITSGPDGLRLAVWRWDATAAEAVAELEAGVEVERVSAVAEDSGSLCNRFRLQFSRAARTSRYTEEARLDGDPYDADDPDHEPSEVCRRSAARYGETEELLLQSDVLYDRATARLVLRHLAAARALPRLRVRYLVAERLAAQLRPGAVVTVTDARLGWSRRVWLVEEVIVRSGTVEIGLICSVA